MVDNDFPLHYSLYPTKEDIMIGLKMGGVFPFLLEAAHHSLYVIILFPPFESFYDKIKNP